MDSTLKPAGAAGTGPVAAAVTAHDVLRLLTIASFDSGANPLQTLNFQLISRKQLENLRELLLQRGTIFSKTEKEAIERGEPEELKKTLLAAQARRAEQSAAAAMSPSVADAMSGTRQSFAALSAQSQEHLPTNVEDGLLGLGKVQPEQDKNRLFAAKQQLLQLTVGAAGFVNKASAPGIESGNERLPLMQFAPGALRRVLEYVGVRTLAEFHAAAKLPGGREILAGVLGVPRPSVLLAAQRAELLLLPVNAAKGKLPHLKDVLLLARLGLASTSTLAALYPMAEKKPEALRLLADLMGKLQKEVPSWLGRAHITRHELREWIMAASRAGSQVEVSAWGEPGSQDASAAAEQMLLWAEDERCKQCGRHFTAVLFNLLLLLRRHKVMLSSDLAERVRHEVLDYGELEASFDFHADMNEALGDEHNADEQRLARGDADDLEASLFTDLSPWLQPDDVRSDGLICFWMERPTGEIMFDLAKNAGEVQRATYVCLDPKSGALLPFGVGAG